VKTIDVNIPNENKKGKQIASLFLYGASFKT